MKITLCGSIAFYNEMLAAQKQLEELGHEVRLPPHEIPGPDGRPMAVADYYKLRKESGDDAAWVWDQKERSMRAHFDKVIWSDIIVVTNYEKRGIKGYIGANTLMEMGLACHLQKPIYLMFEIPDLDYREEILGMKPQIVSDFTQIYNQPQKFFVMASE
ncbi:hypothetical protein KJ611_00420 [Patescibacteria group bacterium]|nr:hypothetical protein [Patescibacteria group bacterium]MBU1705211.1 hypothetical protein [Patescibacteria group bacterium]